MLRSVEGTEESGAVPVDHLIGGHQAHVEAAQQVLRDTIERLYECLDLLAWALESGSDSSRVSPFANDLGALACFTRAYRGLRASTSLCMLGYYVDAEAAIRTVYEAAGLGRMLAKEPDLADKWLRKEVWVPDKDVRTFIEAQVLLEDEESPYQRFYKWASGSAHPSARSTLPLVFDSEGEIAVQLEPRFEELKCQTVGRQIAAVAVFTCFALQRAAVDVTVFPAAWRQELARLARLVLDNDMPHLDHDWEAEDKQHRAMLDAILPIEELQQVIQSHPNSQVNVRKRAAQGEA
jgi:hypothetical protein